MTSLFDSPVMSRRIPETFEVPEIERQLRKLLADIHVGGALPVTFSLVLMEPYSLDASIKVEMVVPDVTSVADDPPPLTISIQRTIPILTYVSHGGGVQVGVQALHESLRGLASWMYEHELKEQFRVRLPSGAERRPFEPASEHAR